jgi:hypothetical protein
MNAVIYLRVATKEQISGDEAKVTTTVKTQ